MTMTKQIRLPGFGPLMELWITSSGEPVLLGEAHAEAVPWPGISELYADAGFGREPWQMSDAELLARFPGLRHLCRGESDQNDQTKQEGEDDGDE